MIPKFMRRETINQFVPGRELFQTFSSDEKNRLNTGTGMSKKHYDVWLL